MFVVIALFASPFESTRIYLTATCYNKPSLHHFFNTMRLKRERGFGGGVEEALPWYLQGTMRCVLSVLPKPAMMQ
jgi:hypothetical protein